MVEFPLDPAQATTWLADRRWYGDKSRTIAHLERKDLATLRIGEHDVDLAVLTLGFDDGGRADYFVPLRSGPGNQPVEALSDAAFQAWLGDGFRDGRQLAMDDGSILTWHGSSVVSDRWWEQSPSPLQGEQSNTSILFGRDAIVKVFRKWQPGINPDTEIVQFLTEEAGFEHVPQFFGSIRLTHDGSVTEVAAVQNFVPNEGDIWKWLPPALQVLQPDDEPALLQQIRLLGQRTGELHVALATGHGDAFGPEELTATDVDAITNRVRQEMRKTVAALRDGGHVPEAEAARLEGNLDARIQDTSSLVGTKLTRVHGDYHSGQVLRSGGDFVIIDFEGEPSRSMEERRMKHSPLKDVAGMVRSLDYATAAASIGASEAEEARLREVCDRMSEVFLAGYRQAIAQGPADLLSTDEDAFTAALDLYMIEKALYETRYELDNRPDWLGIPLGALKRIAGAP